jgi:hypothetical protein
MITDSMYLHDPDGALWYSYEKAFTEVNTLAAQRHLMTITEFGQVLRDTRITKYVASNDNGDVLGHSVLTDDLRAWPLISPAYFERRWPKEYADRRIIYIGWVCALPGAPVTTFPDLIAAMLPTVVDRDCIGVMDFCTHNVVRGLPRATSRILGRLRPTDRVTHRALDAQEFHAWRFDGGDL